MGLFDKLKNVFLEEDFDDDDVPVVKKEKVKEEEKIEKVEETKNEKVEEFKEEVKETIPVNDNTFSDRELLNTKEKFKFPIIFEDEDFKEEDKKTKSINLLERDNTKYETQIKTDVRREKKGFKPSPVISPVYGVLDKNYSKDDITTKDGLLNDYDKVDIDYVIKKASGEYGTREEKREEKKEEEVIDLFKEVEIEDNSMEIPIISKEEEKPVEEKEEEIDEKIKSIDELLKDTTDEDFYSLVDSMYKDGDEEINEENKDSNVEEINNNNEQDKKELSIINENK